MLTGIRDERASPGEIDELRHPGASDHHGLEPLDREHARAVAELASARRAISPHRRARSRATSSPRIERPESPADSSDVVPHVREAKRLQADDDDVLASEPAERGADVVE